MRSLKQLRQDARAIFDTGLSAADASEAVKRSVRRQGDLLRVADRRYDLTKYRSVYIAGAGKAAAKMAGAIGELIGDKFADGIVIVKYGHSLAVTGVEMVEAAHPLPDSAGVEGTRRIVELMEKAGGDDLVFFLISGGGSALLTLPEDGLTLEDKRRTTQALLNCGATIHEINAVRKHISQVKGGRLAKLAYPATLISLILSDVVGDALDSIASGPTVPDRSTFSDCLEILERHKIQNVIPAAVWNFLQRGAKGEVAETPKASDPVFRKIHNVIVGNNLLALQAAKQKAVALGYSTMLLSSFVEGEARVVAAIHAAIAKEIVATGNPVRRPTCILTGGETTVTVRGTGLGGRNQEFALAAAIEIDGLGDVVVLSAGTDGTDGPTDAAGAIVDGATLQRARDKGLDAGDYLRRNDSYPLLQSTGDLLFTGPTFTNVMDLRVMIVA